MTWHRSSNLTLFCVLGLAFVCLSSSYLASAHVGQGAQVAGHSRHDAAPPLRPSENLVSAPDTTVNALIPLTMSYYITGGGTGFYPPTINYTANRYNLTTFLGNQPTTIYVDNGSTWYVHAYLPSYTIIGEQWATPTTNDTGKVGNVPTTILIHYYHQYYVNFAYQVSGGGTGFSGPAVTYYQFGKQYSLVAGSGAWIDAGTQYSYPSSLTGSNSTERWTIASAGLTTGTGTTPGLLTPTYYRQYAVTASYTVKGGGTPPPPSLAYTSLGSQASQPVQAKGTTVWMDSDSSYSMAASVAGATGERWITSSPPSGRLITPHNLTAVYYHQFFVTASYAVLGGGNPSPPAISFDSYGQANSSTLGTSIQNFWADAGPYSVTDPLPGSTSVQRWSAPNATGTFSSAPTLVFSYQRQYDVITTGVQSGSQWVPARSNATVVEPGIFNRTNGAGERIISYSIDGGRSVGVTPTTGQVTITINATSPHTIAFETIAQYELTLDPSTVQALATITPPTIQGDNYWYDANSSVTVALHGAFGRTSGTGSRLAQYTINGGKPVPVATTNLVDAIATSAISGPEAVKSVVNTQYFLTTPEGPLVSATLPTIPGDGLWYDSGTAVTVTYNLVWNETAGSSRTTVLSYGVDGGGTTSLPRKASGTFSVSMTMSKAHTIQLASVVQYLLTVSGGNGIAISAKSPTGDNYYDSGTSVTVTTASTWNVVNGKSRTNLVSYTLDGAEKSVPAGVTGSFSPGPLVLNKAQTLSFEGLAQYYVSFNFTDSSGTATITPTNFLIQTGGGAGTPVTGGGTWLDNGTSFHVTGVVWEGADVTPTNGTAFIVHGPLAVVLPTRVYPLTIKATDPLGAPVSGATVALQLANGSQVSLNTGSKGTVTIAEVPLGPYKGTVSSVGLKSSIQGDAATNPQQQVRVLLSLPIIAIIVGLVAAGVGGALFVRRRAKQAAAEEE